MAHDTGHVGKLEEYSFNFSQTILGNLSGTDSDHRDYIEQSLTAVKAILDRYPSHKELLTSHRDTLQRLLHTTVNEEVGYYLIGIVFLRVKLLGRNQSYIERTDR